MEWRRFSMRKMKQKRYFYIFKALFYNLLLYCSWLIHYLIHSFAGPSVRPSVRPAGRSFARLLARSFLLLRFPLVSPISCTFKSLARDRVVIAYALSDCVRVPVPLTAHLPRPFFNSIGILLFFCLFIYYRGDYWRSIRKKLSRQAFKKLRPF